MNKKLLIIPLLASLLLLGSFIGCNDDTTTTLYFTNGFDDPINDIVYGSKTWTRSVDGTLVEEMTINQVWSKGDLSVKWDGSGGYDVDADTEQKEVDELSGSVTASYFDGSNVYTNQTCFLQSDTGGTPNETANLTEGELNHYTLAQNQ